MKKQSLIVVTAILMLSGSAVAQRAKRPVAAEEDKKAKTDSSLILNFSDYDWLEDTTRKPETKKADNSKTKTDTTYNKLLLDFSDFDWKENTAAKGETFKTVTIGTQTWMAENLNVSTFRNGEAIPEVEDEFKWVKVSGLDHEPSRCNYNGDKTNDEKYGKLYNYDAVKDYRGIAPKGWHVPSVAEWNILLNELGGEGAASKKMRSTNGWKESDERATNQSGFTALAGGLREELGRCFGLGEGAYFWSSTRDPDTYHLHSGYGYKIQVDGTVIKKIYESEGLSIRCIKD